MVAYPGPPWVDMNTMSKLASAAMTVTVTQTPISARRPGTVTYRKVAKKPAPSRRAAS